MKNNFLFQLNKAPEAAGCYLFFDIKGEVLYVGKARNIKKRVRAYKSSGNDGRRRLDNLLSVAVRAEFCITENEQEALILEAQLIKKWQPSFNALLKDDKSFLYLNVLRAHEFPAIQLTRRPARGGQSFGPYPSARAARETKRLIKLAFGLRDCSDATFANRVRACLQKEMGLCQAPCVALTDFSIYQDAVKSSVKVLSGESRDLIEKEKSLMSDASDAENYEVALRSRDRVRALEQLQNPQRVRSQVEDSVDVLGIDVRGAFAVLEYRHGDWVNTRYGEIPFYQHESHAVEMALLALYRDQQDIPREILVPCFPESCSAIEANLSSKRDASVSVIVPRRGRKRRLLRLAISNAETLKIASRGYSWEAISQSLEEIVSCPAPRVIDCVDVSHSQGKETVASRVRFVDGVADTSSWRRYYLANEVSNNDFDAIGLALSKAKESASKDGWADWIVLDGGPPQLLAGRKILCIEDGEPLLFALAKGRPGLSYPKNEERIYKIGSKNPIVLPEDSPGSLFLQHIRNEAHRFALSYHRRKREGGYQVLEEVSGVGPVKARALLDFCNGDLTALAQEPLEKIARLPGVNLSLAEKVIDCLRR